MKPKCPKQCAECNSGIGAIAFKTIVDGYERDFCDPVCVLKWTRKQEAKKQEAMTT